MIFNTSAGGNLVCGSYCSVTLHAEKFVHKFLSSTEYFFFKINIFQNSFRNTIRVSKSLDQDLAWHFVRPDLSPNCLQRLSQGGNSPRFSIRKIFQFNPELGHKMFRNHQ